MNQEQEQGLNAGALFNNDFYCIETYSGYGLLRDDPETKSHLLTPECSDEVLGITLLTALSASRVVDPDDHDFFDRDNVSISFDQWVGEMMNTYSYKTKRALFKNMLSCGVRQLNGMITIRPSVHDRLDGWSGNGIAESDYVIIPDNSTPEEIGAALRLAFSRCKNKM